MPTQSSRLLKASSTPELWAAMQAVPDLISRRTAGLSDAALHDFMAFWPYPIPPAILTWFRIAASAGIGSQHFSLIDRDIDGYGPYATFADYGWPEHGWLVVGGDGSGDYYVVLTRPGPHHGLVCFIDQDRLDALDYAVATSFTKWLAFLAYREARARSHSGRATTRVAASLVRLSMRLQSPLLRSLLRHAQRCLAPWPFDPHFFRRHDVEFRHVVPAKLLPRG